MAASNPSHDPGYGSKSSTRNEFFGEIRLTKQVISIGKATTIALKNITGYQRFRLKKVYRYSILHMVIAGFVALIFLQFMYWGLIFVVPAALVIFLGVKERQRPKLYSITLTLNSGHYYEIVSSDLDGIRALYDKIGEAIHQDAPVNTTFNFNGGKAVIHNGDKVHKGDNYYATGSQVGAMGKGASASPTFNNNGNDPSVSNNL